MDSIARLANTLTDPRYYQIAVLSSLVIFGVVGLDFGIRWIDALLIVTTALAMQYLGTKITGLPRYHQAIFRKICFFRKRATGKTTKAAM